MSLEGKSKEEIEALAALSDDMLSDPKYSGQYKRLLKAKNPNLSMPEIELEDRVVGAFKERDKEIDELKKDKELSQAERTTNTLYEALRDAGAVTTRASFNVLVKYASEKGFMTTESGLRMAAQHRQNELEAAEPTPVTGGAPGFELNTDGELSKAFMKDPRGTALSQAAKAMEELRKLRGKGQPAH
jgi:hypothetical protein